MNAENRLRNRYCMNCPCRHTDHEKTVIVQHLEPLPHAVHDRPTCRSICRAVSIVVVISYDHEFLVYDDFLCGDEVLRDLFFICETTCVEDRNLEQARTLVMYQLKIGQDVRNRLYRYEMAEDRRRLSCENAR
jgi:hypothetical protein